MRAGGFRIHSIVSLSGTRLLLGGVLLVVLADPARAATPTPVELLGRLQESYNRVQSYQVLVGVFARKGRRTENLEMRFAFKKPGMLRARVVAGHSRGAEVAINRDGRIRGRQGGLLHLVTLTLKRNDRRLRNIRGDPVWRAGWGAVLRRARTALRQPLARATVEPGRDGTLLLDIHLEGQDGPERQLYTVDTASSLIRSAELYEGSTLVSRVGYRGERLNPGLADGYFNM